MLRFRCRRGGRDRLRCPFGAGPDLACRSGEVRRRVYPPDRGLGSNAQALRCHVRRRARRGRRRARRRRCSPCGANALDASRCAGGVCRHAGRHAVDHRRHRRICENAAAVRQGDRFVSGGAAYVRRHAAVDRNARSAIYFAAWALDAEPASADRAVATAKIYTSDASREVANRGVQVHGGIGFTWEHDLQLYYKRSKASEILFGDANHHRAQLADLVFSA